jgi:hypothetical protein
MSGRVEKDVLLIVSAGRTGTTFLGRHLASMVEDCWSAHEPDVWDGLLSPHSGRAVRWFGLYHVTLGKLLRRTGVRTVAERWLAGEWSKDTAARALVRQRRRFYDSRPAALVAESNYQWYAALPLLEDVFASYRVLAVVRDPVTWVRSRMNYGGIHDDEDRVRWYGLSRATAASLGEVSEEEWESSSLFQRMCWEWAFVTRRLLAAGQGDPNVTVARYEDLFLSDDPAGRLTRCLETVTDFGHRRYRVEIPPELVRTRENVSTPRRTEGWDTWSDADREFLVATCGPGMRQLGYTVP